MAFTCNDNISMEIGLANTSYESGDLLSNLSDSTNSSSNSTASSDDGWSILPTICALNFVFTVIGNGFLLLIFIRKSSLRTPFNIYLINLLGSNLLIALVQYPFDITSSFGLPGSLSNRACDLYTYASWVFEACAFTSHQVIAVTRIWAVVHPISYRTHHTTKMALTFSICMWVYVHLTTLPFIVLDSMYYRKPIEEEGCNINAVAQPEYNLFVILALFCLPELVMWVAFVIIMLAKKVRKVRPATMLTGTQEVTANSSGKAGGKTTGDHHSQSAVGPNTAVSTRLNTVKRARAQATLVLTVLTLAVTILWTPMNVDYVTQSFWPNFATTYETFHLTALTLASLQTTVDPIVLMFAVRSLRETAISVIRCRGVGV